MYFIFKLVYFKRKTINVNKSIFLSYWTNRRQIDIDPNPLYNFSFFFFILNQFSAHHDHVYKRLDFYNIRNMQNKYIVWGNFQLNSNKNSNVEDYFLSQTSRMMLKMMMHGTMMLMCEQQSSQLCKAHESSFFSYIFIFDIFEKVVTLELGWRNFSLYLLTKKNSFNNYFFMWTDGMSWMNCISYNVWY